ncbi:TetR/AcrR family transcriptional regulator [Streptomyces sp. NBC_00234]|uniref:TetR/AcrR family transcriptional regulator n=1 Tax=Streptomyces sp. NBC_00234 TaxID=2903638 RepID=UPI002E27E027|nr:helix-turn-helix domain-containing protein [Streptomyces sp. NBC_00234]
MATAREALLDAALAAIATRPWAAVRMVDVATAAGVSRQTLYNEFGSKDGLARALIRRATDGYLAGVEKALAAGQGPAALALWTVHCARTNALVRALLTGFWGERLPRPVRAAPPSAVPARRRADAATPAPAELLALVRDRAVAALGEGRPGRDAAELAVTCEIALRLALSYALVPPAGAAGPDGAAADLAPLVREAVARRPGGLRETRQCEEPES